MAGIPVERKKKFETNLHGPFTLLKYIGPEVVGKRAQLERRGRLPGGSIGAPQKL
jgi:hypothetical protein